MGNHLHVGVVPIGCGQCDAVIDVPVSASLQADEQGEQQLVCIPDLIEVAAHAWTHEEAGR